MIQKKDTKCYDSHIKVRFLSKEGEDTSGYLNSEGVITNKSPRMVKCDYVNVKLFDTGLVQIIKRLGQYNSLISKDALDALSVKFAYDVKIEVSKLDRQPGNFDLHCHSLRVNRWELNILWYSD